MKIKDGTEAYTGDFWYDLIDRGYLKPEELLENEEDVQRVYDAINTLVAFRDACEEQIEDFFQ